MVKEKINQSTVVVCEVLNPTEILTIIKYCQFLLEIWIAIDTCMANNKNFIMPLNFATTAVYYNTKVIITVTLYYAHRVTSDSTPPLEFVTYTYKN